MSDGIIHISGRTELPKATINRQRGDHARTNSTRADGSGERPESGVTSNHDKQDSENAIWRALHGA
jgi:hypothetical protein